jgi:hypothetical protein
MVSYKMPNENINENISVVRKQQQMINKDKNKKVEIESKANAKEDSSEDTVASYNSKDISQITGSLDPRNYKKNKGIEIFQNNINSVSEVQNEHSFQDEIKGEFDSYNIEQRKRNQVIKIPIGDLMSHLSLNEKGKLMAISTRFKEDDYEKFEEYLGYKNQKVGVRKALEVLEEKLPPKQVEEIKEILSKYIDMKVVEENK